MDLEQIGYYLYMQQQEERQQQEKVNVNQNEDLVGARATTKEKEEN